MREEREEILNFIMSDIPQISSALDTFSNLILFVTVTLRYLCCVTFPKNFFGVALF